MRYAWNIHNIAGSVAKHGLIHNIAGTVAKHE